jgi:hypothetical protein
MYIHLLYVYESVGDHYSKSPAKLKIRELYMKVQAVTVLNASKIKLPA